MEIGALVKQQYQVIEHIGRGGMADVWSARDTRLQRMVAIKTVAAGMSSDGDMVALFEKEAQTIAQMEHPHILPIYDFGEYDNSLFIVMRYISSGSLENVLHNGFMPVDEVLKMGEAVAKALDHAHENNVIHLDLKPPNILLDSTQVPYLADFGLAAVLDRDGRARNPGSGTLLYMAPEQLTSETIDHRADIYSFCIMLYHMLTGQLPLDGAASLAMRQIQQGTRLGLLSDHVDLPDAVSEILIEGTSLQPDNRPSTHMDIIERIREVMQPTSIDIAFEPYAEDSGDPADEARIMYEKALHAWQGGNGRFLLGVTHYMLMSAYYQHADVHGLSINREGYQMLLRGAIEYDFQLSYWWNHRLARMDDQRWVCLHAVRSGNTSARIRAFNRLETLPQQQNDPIIPNLVAQALEVERDADAKLAALAVLEARTGDVEHYKLNIDADKMRRAGSIASISRTFSTFGIQVTEESVWHEVVYAKDIDTLIAETAFDDSAEVAEYAARVVGRIHSLTAIEYLANAQQDNRYGALDALAYVRDESPALPDIVSRQGRSYAWITNTVRRLVENPIDLMQRMLLVFLLGTIAMGEQVFILFRNDSFASPEKWGNTLGVGILFGVFITLTYVVTDYVSRRLEGFWLWWQRLALTFLLGYGMALLTYGGYTWLFYRYRPEWDMIRFVALGLTLAFVLGAVLRLKRWQGVLLTVIFAYYPIVTVHLAHYHIRETSLVHIPFVAFLLGAFVGIRAAQLSPITAAFDIKIDRRLQAAVVAVLGIAVAIGYWWYFAGRVDAFLNSGSIITWDIATLLFLPTMLVSALGMYWLSNLNRLTLLLSFVGAFVGLFVMFNWYFLDLSYTVPNLAGEPVITVMYFDGAQFNPNLHLSPLDRQTFIHFDTYSQVVTVTLPMIITVAIGLHIMSLLNGWWDWIGKSKNIIQRSTWHTSVLTYTLLTTALASILTLFSVKDGFFWAVGWSLWASITFVLAMASYRWARWGANGLIASAVVFLIGSFFVDWRRIADQIIVGETPQYLSSASFDVLGQTITFSIGVIWVLWALGLGFLAWGALRDKLWAGIGAVGMLILWYCAALFTPLQASVVVFAATNMLLLLYVLKQSYALHEVNRLQMPQLAWANFQRGSTSDAISDIPEALPTQPIVVANPEDLATEYDLQINRIEEDQVTEFNVRDNKGAAMPTQASPDMPTRVNATEEIYPERANPTPEFLPDVDTVIDARKVIDTENPTAKAPSIKINTKNIRTEHDISDKPPMQIKTDNLRTERKKDVEEADEEE